MKHRGRPEARSWFNSNDLLRNALGMHNDILKVFSEEDKWQMKTGRVIHMDMEYLRCSPPLSLVVKPGLFKYGVADSCNIFCCVFRPMREKGVGELLL